jgi:uncharacterized membrane protein YbhN (UPF0104 family)
MHHLPLLKSIVRVAGTALACAVVFQQIAAGAVIDRLAALRLPPLLVAVVMLAAQLIVWSWRWQRILMHLDTRTPTLSLTELCWLLGAGTLFGQLLPATIGGDVVRAAALARKVDVRAAVLSTILDRAAGLLVLIMLIVLLSPLLAWRLSDDWRYVALAALGVVIGTGALAVVPYAARRLAPALGALKTPLVDAVATTQILWRPSLGIPVLISSILVQLASVLLVYVLGWAAGVPLGLLDCLLLVPPALLLSALPISINGWGVREGALAAAFALVGVPMSDTVTVSILYGLIGPLTGLVYGMLALLRPRPPSAHAPFTASHSKTTGCGSAQRRRGPP